MKRKLQDLHLGNTRTDPGLLIQNESGQDTKGQRQIHQSHETSVLESDLLSGVTFSTPPLSPSIGGAEVEAAVQTGQKAMEAGETIAPSLRPSIGNLHKRRASTSPEKFNTRKFELFPLRTDLAVADNDERPAKRPRTENKLEISYDRSGTPRIASVTSMTVLPSGLRIPTPRSISQDQHRPQRSKKERFRLLDKLCRHNDLTLLLVSYLTIPSLLSVYAISKPFHWLFNRHFTAFILSHIRTWAPGSEIIFPWRCYKSLCIKDPVLRQKSKWAGRENQLRMKDEHEDLRDVPSLRWLQMVVWRHGICKDILIQLALQGLRCPKGTLDAMKRMWFIMDLPLNAHRIALCRNQKYLTNQAITRAMMFLLKVDMFFTDPAGQTFSPTQQHTNTMAYPRPWERCTFVGCDLRELLMAERQLSTLWRVIRGWSPNPSKGNAAINRMDILWLWVRQKYVPPNNLPEGAKTQPIMDIPWYEVGTAGFERTGVSFYSLDGKQKAAYNPGLAGPMHSKHQNQQMLYPHHKRIIVPTEKPRELLLRPDELILRESIRRKMKLHEQWVRMMLWGFCDDAGRNLPLRSEGELIQWSKGFKPKHSLLSDEEFETRKAEAVMKAMKKEMMKEEESTALIAVPAQPGEL